jgi:hypothetical protein
LQAHVTFCLFFLSWWTFWLFPSFVKYTKKSVRKETSDQKLHDMPKTNNKIAVVTQFPVRNYLICKWNKLSGQKIDWHNG